MIRQTIIALALLTASIGAVRAGEIEDLAREAEKQASAGQHLQAIETLRRATNLMAAKGPFLLRKVQFITEPPKGFGIYTPRPGNVFPRGEALIVYAEPIGMTWKTEGAFNRAAMATDFDIRTPDGKVLGGQKEFGKFEFNSRELNQEIHTHLTITLTGAQPSKYVLVATYRDLIGGKRASLELPFEIK
jgi:hypothetical protein